MDKSLFFFIFANDYETQLQLSEKRIIHVANCLWD